MSDEHRLVTAWRTKVDLATAAIAVTLPSSAAPTVDVTGDLALDTSITDHQPLLKYYSGVEEMSVIALPTTNLTATGGHVVAYNATNDEFEMVNPLVTAAPIGEAYVTIGNTAGLTAERALTGTANQIVITDNGANSTVVLSTPQDIATTSNVTFGSETLLRAGVALDAQNTTDAASNQVAILRSGNRATPAANDEGYLSLFNDDSTGTQVEFSRLSWKATDVTNTSKDSQIEFDVMVANTLTLILTVRGLGILVAGDVSGTTIGGITEANLVDKTATEVITGNWDFGGAASMEIPNSAAPVVDANGEIAVDTMVTDWSHGIIRYFGGEELFLVAMPVEFLVAPGNGYIIRYNATNDEFGLEDPANLGFALNSESFITISNTAGLSAERRLVGTANQVIVTDNGANSTVALSTPQSIATTSNVTFGSATLLRAGVALDIQNTTDAASNQVAIFKSGDRVTPAANDEGYLSLFNDDSTGTQVEFSRLSWKATDVTSTSKDSQIEFDVMVANTLTLILTVRGVGILVAGDVSGTTIGGITEANLVDKSATETITGAWDFTRAGLGISVQNTTDAASNQVAVLKSGDRVTPAVNDEGYLSLFNDDSTGTQVEFSRLSWKATDVTAASKDSQIELDVMVANTLTLILTVRGLGILVAGDISGTTIGGITEANLVDKTATEVITGSWDFGGAGSLEIPNSATPTVDAAGEVAVDTTVTGHTGLITYHDGVEALFVIALPTANLTTTNNHIIRYNSANSEFEMVAASTLSAPVGSAFVTIGNDGTLTAERALTGTANQITITDNGANSTVVLSTPQDIAATSNVTFGSATLARAGVALDAQNTTDATSNQVVVLRSGDRVTPANNDEGYLSLLNDNSTGTQVEFSRFTWVATDVTAASKDAQVEFAVMVANTLTDILTVRGLGILVAGDVSGTTIGGITEANLVDKSATETITGAWDFTRAGLALAAQNTTDAASNQVLVLRSGNRAIPAANDEGYVTFQNDDSTGTQVEFSRLSWKATDVTAASKDSQVEFDVMVANALTLILTVLGTGITVVGDVSGTTIGGITEANLVDKTATEVITGSWDFGGAGSLAIPNSATPTVDANGEIALDTTVTDWSHGIIRYFGGEELFLVAMPVVQLTTPPNGFVIAYNSTNDEFELVAQTSGGAPTTAQYVTLATDATLTQERVLTGTASQITITDNGAGSTVVLSTPQNIATTSTVTFGSATLVRAGVALDAQNTTDAASNQVVIFRSGDRVTPAANDEGYLSLFNDDSTGTQVEFSRLSWKATDVTNTSKDSQVEFDVMVANTLTLILTVRGLGVLVAGDVSGTTIGGITEANLVDKSATETITGSWDFTRAGLGIAVQNTTDAASNQVAILRSGDRAIPAANDEGYVTFQNDDSTGTQVEFSRLSWKATDVTAASKDSQIEFDVMVANTLTLIMTIRGLGILVVGDVSGTTIGGITEANLVDKTATEVITGSWDFGGAGSLEIPNSATPVVDANGEIALDTTVTDWSHGIIRYFGGEELFLVAMPVAQLTTPSNGFVVAYNATNDEFELVAQSGGAGAGEAYVTIGNTAGLSAERALTGTASQITVTDNGANSTVVLSTPQNIATTSNVTFGSATLLRAGVALDAQNTTDAASNQVVIFRSGDRVTPAANDEGYLSLFNDDSTGTQVEFSRFSWKATDVTNTSKDSQVEFDVMVANTLTLILTVRGVGILVAGDVSGTTIGGITEANLVDKSATEIITGAWDFTRAGVAITGQNTTDAASNQVAILKSGDRAVPAANDEGYITFQNDDSTGTQVEFSRLSWKATDVTAASKDSQIEFDVMVANTLTLILTVQGLGILVAGDVSGTTIGGITEANLVDKTATEVITGSWDFGGAGSLEIPNSATPVVDANGEIALDTTVTDWSHGIIRCFGGEELFLVAMPVAQLTTPSNGFVIAYNATNDEFELVAQSGGASAAEAYVTIGNTAGLSAERALTGTANQVIVTDNGANSTVVLSTPQSIATTSSVTFGSATLVRAGVALDAQNTTDAASNQVVVFRSGDRVTPAANDEGYLSLFNDDSTGTQVEFSRLSWKATDVTNTSKDSQIEFDVMVANTLTLILTVRGVGILVAGDVSGTTIGGITEANLVDKSATETITGAWDFTRAGLGLAVQNTTDAASNQVAILRSGDRAVPAANDEGYVTLQNDDSTGTQVEFSRLSWKATDVTAASKDSQIEFDVMVANTLTLILTVRGLGILVAGDVSGTTIGGITEANLVDKTATEVITGSWDFGGAGSLEIPNSATPTVDANGEIALDTTVTDWSHGIIRYFGGEELFLVAMPVAALVTPTNGNVVAYNATNDEFELVSNGAGTGEAYVTIGNTAGLSAERSLTGTANQVIITDNGANSTVVLSTPQDIATTSNVTFGSATLARAGVALDIQNSTDAASVQTAIFRGGNRTTAANNDNAYVSLTLEDSAGAQAEFARMRWFATDVTSTSKDAQIEFHLQVANVLTGKLAVTINGITVVGDVNATTIGGITQANLVDKTDTETITGAWDFTRAGLGIAIQNTTDAASNQVAILRSGNRATPAANDEGYVTFQNDDSTGTQVEFSRLSWKATDVTAASKDSQVEVDVMVANTLTLILTVLGTGISVVGDVAGTTIGGITQANLVDKTDTEVITGSWDFGGAGSLEIPNSATPTVDANGEIALDTTVTDWSHGIIRYFGGEELFVVSMPVAALVTPTGGNLIAYNATNDEFELVAPSASSAPVGSAFVTIGNDATLTAERALTGTANQVTVTDNGANSTVVLSLPQSIATTSVVTFGAATLTRDGLPLTVNRTTDAASNQVADFIGNNRAIPANGDEGYFSLRLDDSSGATAEFARITWEAKDVDNLARDGEVRIAVSNAGTLADRLVLQDNSFTLGAASSVTSMFILYGAGFMSALSGVTTIGNDTNAASNQVLVLRSGNRTTPTNNDEGYLTFQHETSASVFSEFSRVTSKATDVTDASKDAQIEFDVMVANTLTLILTVLGTGITVVGDVSGTTIGGITEANLVDKTATEVITGSWDFGGAGSLEIPNSATPTVDANGEIALDTTVTDWSHGIIRYFGGEELFLVAMPVAALVTPTNGNVIAYNATNDEFELVTPSAGPSEAYVTIGNTAGLTQERALTGTANQVIITDNGANSTVVLSTPQDIATTSNVTFGSATLLRAGVALDAQNTTDAASNQVVIFRSGDRVTPAANDEGYLSLFNDDSTGTQVEFSRVSWKATDVTSTSKDSQVEFDVMVANTLTLILTVQGTGINLAASTNVAIGGTNILADASGTTTLSNIDALDATTEATIEAAIDTLANLTSIQSLTVTLADAGADAILGWDDSVSAYENLTQAEVLAVIGSASLTAQGVVELATAAETTTGTDATRAVTPDGLAGSDYGKRIVTIQVESSATDLTVGDAKGGAFWTVPSEFNGWLIVGVVASVAVAGTTGTTDFQLHNVTDAVDVLSTKATIDSTETTSLTAATPPVINTANDDLASGDLFRVDIDAVSTTKPKGGELSIIIQAP